MAFTPRFTQPEANNKWWTSTTRGGMNPCTTSLKFQPWWPGCVCPNCVGFAFGRFSEILGTQAKLSRGNAGTWFSYGADGYQRGNKPALGAVMCFSKPGTAGHVGIVEQINDDGSIIMSESSYNNGWFKGNTVMKPPYNYGSYTFQGCIYNPGAEQANDELAQDQPVVLTKKELMIQAAELQVNADISWTKEKTGISKNSAWSAAFLLACAKEANGLINVIIPNTTSSSAIGRIGELRKFGTWHKGPAQGKSFTPEAGDIILFRKSIYKDVNTYFADRSGLVVEVIGSTLTVIEGDSGGVVKKKNYKKSSQSISGYFRPNWSVADGLTQQDKYSTIQGLYADEISISDAAVREIGYISKNQPSIKSSTIKLSVLNYTGLLANMYSVFGGQLATSDAINATGQVDPTSFVEVVPGTGTSPSDDSQTGQQVDVSGNAMICYNYLKGKGLSSAMACGIIGNIKHESNFNPAAKGDKINGVYTSFGLCQWHYGRGDAMKAMAGSNWQSNVTGQMDYLWSELNGSESKTLSAIKSAPDTEAGAAYAADQFVRKFERPAHIDDWTDGDGVFHEGESTKRKKSARDFYASIVTQH